MSPSLCPKCKALLDGFTVHTDEECLVGEILEIEPGILPNPHNPNTYRSLSPPLRRNRDYTGVARRTFLLK